MEPAKVDSVMLEKPELVDPDVDVMRAAELLSKRPERCLVVGKNHFLLGIVTASDLIEKVVAEGANPAAVPLGDIMTTPVVTVNVNATVTQAAELMSEYGIGKLPVVEDSGELVGMFTSLELSRWLAQASDFRDPALNAVAKLKKEGAGPYE